MWQDLVVMVVGCIAAAVAGFITGAMYVALRTEDRRGH